MATDKTVEISKEFFNILAALNVKSVLGSSLVFRKTDDGFVCSRFDEDSKNVFFYLVFDEYSFKFPGDQITFNNYAVFLDACKRQGFLKDPTFKIARMVDKKGYDVLQIHNKKSSMSYKLYDPNAYPEEIGFLEDISIEDLDPVSFSFELTSKEIEDIADRCQSRHFECDTFYFIKKPDCLVLCFTGPNDLDYKIRIEKADIINFDAIDIGEEIKFSFNCFTLMNQIGLNYSLSLLSKDDNNNILCSAQLTEGNQVIKSLLFASSRISNE